LRFPGRKLAESSLFPLKKPRQLVIIVNHMAKKSDKQSEVSKDLWIAPRYSLKGPAGERAWENRPGGAPNSSRFLELADIALGVKKPSTKKKRTSGASAHQTAKTEPYSGMDYDAKDNFRR
jgi:hypothetical protein